MISMSHKHLYNSKTNINIFNFLLTVTMLLGCALSTNASQRIDLTSQSRSLAVKVGSAQTVEEATNVTLDASNFSIKGTPARYQWQQISGAAVRLDNPDSAIASFIAPAFSSDGTNSLTINVIITSTRGYKTTYSTQTSVIPAQPKTPPPLIAQRNANEFLIDGKYHPLGNELVAVIHFPPGASAANPVPGCAIIHGSGGLFKENGPGASCKQDLESTYAQLNDQLLAKGIATILPSSFYSRDHRFCEDNDDDYLPFASAPFFNGNDIVARDDGYKTRRVAIRAMDMLATMTFFCDLEQVDCSKTCMVGTSNGGTSIMSYTAQSLDKDLLEFLDDSKRPFESNNSHTKRNAAFANFPPLTVSNITLTNQLTHRPLPRFAQLVSPGCSMRNMVPDIMPGAENLPFALDQLFYPAKDTQLAVEVGTADEHDVPAECYIDANNQNGLREIQARYFEDQMGMMESDSQYIIFTHQDGVHDLLNANGPFSVEIKDRLNDLVDQYLLP